MDFLRYIPYFQYLKIYLNPFSYPRHPILKLDNNHLLRIKYQLFILREVKDNVK